MEREIIEREIELNQENFEIVSEVDIDVNKVDKTATVSIKRWDGSTKEVEIYDGENGKDGINGKDGRDGIDGKDGVDGKDGINGTNGVSLDYNWQGTSLGIKREDESNYDYVNLKGDTGNTGATGPSNVLTIGVVQKGDDAEATITGTSPNQVLNLVLPKGDKGDTGSQGQPGQTGQTGATGNGISNIEKTSTSGLVDTYTITYTNGNIDTFNVTNGADGQQGQSGRDGTNGTDGVGISNIQKTSTSGLVDTYTITYTNGNSTTYEVTNGANGINGQDGADGQDGYSPTASVSQSGNITTITITDKTGTTTQSIDLSNYIQKSQTSGLVKNDGTIDTNTYLTQHQDISGKEDKTNKVTSISASSTDTQYPSAKCVYDAIYGALNQSY